MKRLYEAFKSLGERTENYISLDKFISIYNLMPPEMQKFTNDDIINMGDKWNFKLYVLYEKDIPIAVAIVDTESVYGKDNKAELVFIYSYYTESYITLLRLLLYKHDGSMIYLDIEDSFKRIIKSSPNSDQINITDDEDNNRFIIEKGNININTILKDFLDTIKYYTKSIIISMDDNTYDLYMEGAGVDEFDLLQIVYRKRPKHAYIENIFEADTDYHTLCISIFDLRLLLKSNNVKIKRTSLVRNNEFTGVTHMIKDTDYYCNLCREN